MFRHRVAREQPPEPVAQRFREALREAVVQAQGGWQ